MRKSNHFLFFGMLFFIITISAYGEKPITFHWPVSGDRISDKLTSLFGESRGDHFHNGVDIASSNESVLSIAPATVLYSRFGEDNPYENEAGTGNSVWLDHGNGILSAYYHLKDSRIDSLYAASKISEKDKIGYSGNTGHSSGSHLHFLVMDKYGARIVNPLPFLPAVNDSMPPVIGNLIVTVGESHTNVNDGDNISVSKDFPISVTLSDPGTKKGQRRGIMALQITFNGAVIKESRYTELRFINSRWINENGFGFEDLFFENNYYLGDLNFRSGENTIKVYATDFNGNSASKSFSFYASRK